MHTQYTVHKYICGMHTCTTLNTPYHYIHITLRVFLIFEFRSHICVRGTTGKGITCVRCTHSVTALTYYAYTCVVYMRCFWQVMLTIQLWIIASKNKQTIRISVYYGIRNLNVTCLRCVRITVGVTLLVYVVLFRAWSTPYVLHLVKMCTLCVMHSNITHRI